MLCWGNVIDAGHCHGFQTIAQHKNRRHITAVAVTVRAGVAIFLPEQLQGHVTMTLQLFMNGGEVWRGLLSGWLWGWADRRKQRRLQSSVVPTFGQPPTDCGGLRSFQILLHR